VADAPAIGEVHVRSWQAAYEGLIPADFLARLSAEMRGFAAFGPAAARPGRRGDVRRQCRAVGAFDERAREGLYGRQGWVDDGRVTLEEMRFRRSRP
jgi:hypothetical protein